MKRGNVVRYRGPDGVPSSAVVVAVVGTGASGAKVLDLLHFGAVLSAVSHVADSDGESWDILPPFQPAEPVEAVPHVLEQDATHDVE